MQQNQPKKLLIINILEILKTHTDAEHTLTQKDIERLLMLEYGMKVDRKAIRRNIMDLRDFGYDIECREEVRITKNARTGEAEENVVMTDFYINREFTDAELRLLIDSLLFSRHVPRTQCRELIDKLEGLSNKHFRSSVRHITALNEDHTDNKQVFLNVEILNDAIQQKKQVAFKYLRYGTDKVLHPRERSDGSEIYVVSPYQMVARDGKYFLICNFGKYEDISNYRLDRMRDIVITQEPIRPFETLKNANGAELDLKEYMDRHPYMFAGEDRHAQLRITHAIVSDVIDLFGKNVTFKDEDETGVTVSVHANEKAIEQFAQCYTPDAIVLAPKDMAQHMKALMQTALERYEKQSQ